MLTLLALAAPCWRLRRRRGSAWRRTGRSERLPRANPRLEVTSTELNLFVWTEYIPQDTIDCFEEVYGITVNQSEYSSNEELYAKLNAGGANYDLVQPTDYIVALMIRQGLLQELDKASCRSWRTLDPNYLNLRSTQATATRCPTRPAPTLSWSTPMRWRRCRNPSPTCGSRNMRAA
jgi:spermidine/putrescine-binding protein